MTQNTQQNGNGGGNAVALQPTRLPLAPAIAKEFDLDAATWRVLVDQIYPSAKTKEAVLMALSYCKSRKLDIMKRPVHIVPMWSSLQRRMVETVWPGIAEVRTTASRTKSYAGMEPIEFGPEKTETFKGNIVHYDREGNETGREPVSAEVTFPEWASCTVWRIVNGERCAFNAKVFWKEACAREKSGIPNAMWQKRPYGQLDKCVEAAALRRAFPEELGNELTADEMHDQTIIEHDPLGLIAEQPAKSRPPSAPSATAAVTEPAKAETASSGHANEESEDDQKPSNVEDVEGEPIPENPEDVFKEAERMFTLCKTVEDCEEVWSSFEHYAEKFDFPGDWAWLEGIKDRHVRRCKKEAKQ